MKKSHWSLLTLASIFLYLLCTTSCTSLKITPAVTEDDPVLTLGDKTIKLSELKAQFQLENVAVPEPHHPTTGLTKMKGFRVIPLFDSVLGKEWRTKDAILYTCTDGYHADVPVAKILSGNPILTVSFANPKLPFTAVNTEEGNVKVPLGPYYLVWEVQKHPELRADAAYIWPYQVTQLQPINYSIQYASSLPFKKVTPALREGFEYTKNYCLNCHALSGTGGEKGPLLWPNPDVIKDGYAKFEKWVLHPQSIKPDSTMASLNPVLSLEKRKAVAKKIFAYLKALNNVKPPEKNE